MKILIHNAIIITQNEKREVIDRGFIIVENGKIADIGSGVFSGKIEDFDDVIDVDGRIVAPGLINAHVHLGETVYNDFLPEKFTLEEYLLATNSFAEKFPFIEKHRKVVADYTALKLAQNGTGTIAGGRVNNTGIRWGLRNISGYMIMNSSKLKKYYSNIDNSFESEVKNCKELCGGLSYLGIFIHSLNYVDEKALVSVGKILKKMPYLPVMIHVAETKKQEDEIRDSYGVGSVEVLKKYGLLNDHTLLIHANWCSEKDFEIIKNSGASLVHCLSSNLKVADNVLDINNAMERGINVCIATDGFCTAGTFSVLDEARKVLKYNNKHSKITAQKVLDMITIDAAKALGVSSKIGSIEIGKAADFTYFSALMDLKKHSDEMAVSILSEGVVEDLMVDSSMIMWDKRMSMKDEKNIIDKYSSLIKKIREGANENYSG